MPQPGDADYLCLIDLLTAIRTMAPGNAERILDYGCGGSPYRSLFAAAVYHRADLSGGTDLDFEYAPDSVLPPEVGGYDFVLSSQVLEHVLDPALYLSECFRVLEPGGQLLVTTHGTFCDHACPHDYWRWTAYGLSRLLNASGFEPIDVQKLTTGPRAALYLFEQNLDRKRQQWFGIGRNPVFALTPQRHLRQRHQIADIKLAANTVVKVEDSLDNGTHALYIGLAVLARKPKDNTARLEVACTNKSGVAASA